MEDFYLLRCNAGLTRDQVAEICGVTKKTVRNWENDGAPKMARLIVGLYCGRLEFLGDEWKQFRFVPGVIETLDGHDFIYPGEILGIRYLYEAAGIERFRLCCQLECRDLLYHIRNSKIKPPEKPGAEIKIIKAANF